MPEKQPIPYALYRADQVRALDRCAIEQHGIPAFRLMQRAGRAAFGVLRTRWPDAQRILVLAGAGNNGGDGYVLAAEALAAGLDVRLLTLGDQDRLSEASAAAAARFVQEGGSAASYQRLPGDVDVIVDALLGTGLTREVSGQWAAAIDAVNAARAPVLALDIASGLDADTGRVLGTAVRAHATVSFIGLKQGLFTGRGPACSGAVYFHGLGVPPGIYATQVLSARRVDWRKERELLPPRSADAHKGSAGHVLVVGGAPGMSGAPRLAGEAALRAGAGLVTIATHPAHASVLNLTRPELMVQAVAAADELAQAAARADVIAVGPGLGRDDWGRTLLDAVLGLDRRLVVDADALNLLARAPQRREQWILTPHPGEAARLLEQTAAAVEQDRFTAAAALQRRFGGAVVLKGAGTLVHGPGQRPPAVCSDGSPAMASAGMGDALTGIIAALWAQAPALDAQEAATAGVCLHAAAGELAAAGTDRGLLAGDLIATLPRLLVA
ncbi:NAD(P)H-hydrate dehydratase [uncultured Thiohalocapsa sp.]|uniref:NAD(P)H-hydrate dehydratase n=1 Tax=uncultured Thiohalocapsa sp. TaxID=768990 RepID=UPI0025E490BC|nr:NAD(P)H-hydrate dehydratase [uncultured Thiohalocapsa sp.]